MLKAWLGVEPCQSAKISRMIARQCYVTMSVEVGEDSENQQVTKLVLVLNGRGGSERW